MLEAPRPASATISTSSTRDLLLSVAAVIVLFFALVRCLVPISPNLHFDGDPRHAVTFTDEAPPTSTPQAASTPPADDSNQQAKPGEKPSAAAVPALSLGPAGAAWLDAMALAAAGVAMLVHVRAGGAIRWLDLALVAIGGLAAAIHLPRHIDNVYIGGGWIGAAALAVAALHLAQHTAARRWFIAAILAPTDAGSRMDEANRLFLFSSDHG